jgi:signal transduction histidine kinase
VFKSYKLRLFLALLGITFSIIFSNRFVAQFMLTAELERVAAIELAADVERCQGKGTDQDEFERCLHMTMRSDSIEPISFYYQTCWSPASDSATCASARAAVLSQTVGVASSDVTVTQWADVLVASVPVRAGSFVLLARDDVRHLLIRMWSLRDNALIYVLPFVLFSVACAVWLLVALVMRPIDKIKGSVQKLSADNLSSTEFVAAPYIEFQGFADVFDSLRRRLSNSLSLSRRFAADASHELKTPLTVLRGRAEMLVASLSRGSDEQAMALEVLEEVEHMSEIVEKLLLLSRADAKALVLEKNIHNFSDLMDDFLSDAASYAPDIELRTAIQPGVFWVCDVALIRLLVQNLYSNAIKYNEPKGWVRVRLESRAGRGVLIIENPAKDIPPELPSHAFDRFYRLDSARSSSGAGHGLGLSICQEIAHAHRAKLNMTVLPYSVRLTVEFDELTASVQSVRNA